MTSSLVGSEMCIRDSVYLRKMWTCFELVPGEGSNRGAHAGWGWGDCCLLYTSDAADECRSRWS
eukprot:3198773-Prorocentrum_lima.AAC.1